MYRYKKTTRRIKLAKAGTKKMRKRPASQATCSCSYWVFENGRLAETRGGRQLIFRNLNIAKAVARVVFGDVRKGLDMSPERRGRKIDIRVMKARAELEMAGRKRKPSLYSLNEKYFGPFRTHEARLRSRENLKKAIHYLRKREQRQKGRLEHLLAI